MAQLSDDCFAFGGELMWTGDALAELPRRLGVVVETETVSLRQAAGRILAEDLRATFPVPPCDNAAVDGYAAYFDDLHGDRETRLPVTGRIAAGQVLGQEAKRGEAIRIFTGAPMPGGRDGSEGPDTVLMQEDCVEADGHVTIPPGIKRGANRRHAGEDISPGDIVLATGRRLRAQDIGVAASMGRGELTVYRKLRAALFSTGDEVREVGSTLDPGCIFDANRYALAVLLEGLGCDVNDLGILPDAPEPVRHALAEAAGSHDLIVTSAGVSTGEEDHVRSIVEELGSIHFWRLAIRPGRPIALGQVARVPFIGLPGNPVAAMVTFMRFARPAILLLAGCTHITPHLFRVEVDFAYSKKAGRREWLRATLSIADDGTIHANKFPRGGAGILTSMVAADGLIELPEDLTSLEVGTMVDFIPFNEVS